MILTLGLVLLVIFFYQQSFDKALIGFNRASEVKEKTDDIRESLMQMNSALNELKSTTELSNNFKKNKKEIQLGDEEDKYVFVNENIGLKMFFDKKIFSNEGGRNFVFDDGADFIGFFDGRYLNKELAISVLANRDIENCLKDKEIKITNGDNVYSCNDTLMPGDKYSYGITCNIVKYDYCFNFEYISFTDKIDDEIKVENILLNNILFVN